MKVGDLAAELRIDFSKFDRDERVAKGRVTALGGMVKNALSFALGMSLSRALDAVFRDATSTAIGFNAQLQAANMGFKQMLGSTEAATKFMGDLTSFSAKTPFEFPGLLDASRRMMAMRWETGQIIPDLTTVGDALAGIGKFGPESVQNVVQALGRMKMFGRVSAREMMMLINAGIPAWQLLADETGKTIEQIRDMSMKGLLSADAAVGALLRGMDKKFGGMMNNLENSWYGVTATIKDVWRLSVGAITEDLFKGLNQWLVGVKNFAQKFYDALKAGGLEAAIREIFGAEAAGLFSLLAGAARGAWGVLTGLFATVRANWGILAPLIKGALALFVSFNLVRAAVTAGRTAMTMFRITSLALAGESVKVAGVLGLLNTIVTYYRILMLYAAGATGVFSKALAVLRSSIQAVWLALGLPGIAVLALSGILMGGMALWNKYNASVRAAGQAAQAAKLDEWQKDVADSAGRAADGAGDLADGLGEAGKAAGKSIQSFDEVHQLQEDMADSALDADLALDAPSMEGIGMPDLGDMLEEQKGTIKGFLTWCWDGIKSGAASAWKWIADTAGSLWDGIKTKWQGFQTWFKDTWAGKLWDNVKASWGAFKEWAGGLWDAVKDRWGDFKTWAADMWEGAKAKWATFKESAGQTWSDIKTVVQEKWNDLKANAPVVWDSIKTTIGTRWNNLKADAAATWSDITTTIGNKWQELRANAPTVWEEIKTGVASRWDDLKASAPGVWEDIKAAAETRWNDLKASAPATWEDIRAGIAARWDDLKANAPQAWEAIKQEIASRTASLKDSLPSSWEDIQKGLEETWSSIKGAATRLWGGVTGTVRDAVNGIIKFVNKFIKGFNEIKIEVPSVNIPLVGKVGGWSVSMPQIPEIPMLGKGGIAANPTLAMIGEAGPEAVIPLGRSGFADDLADTVAQSVYAAIRDAFRALRMEQSGDRQELILEIDGNRIARAILPAMTREGQRLGTPVLRGV